KAGTHRIPPTPSHLPVARTTAAADGGRRPRRCHRVPNGRFETCGDSRVIAAAVHTVHCGSLTMLANALPTPMAAFYRGDRAVVWRAVTRPSSRLRLSHNC